MPPADRPITWSRWLALVPLALFGLHAWHHLQRGVPEQLLWFCPLSTALLALGIALRSPVLVRMTTVGLLIGLPFWLVDVWENAGTSWSSLGIHLLAPCCGLALVRRIGLPWATVWQALALLIAIRVGVRWCTDPALNVNHAFTIHHGWEAHFSRFVWFWLTGIGLCTALAITIVAVLRRCLVQRPAARG